ncbi:MAG: hypothetical protein O2877_02690, partial [bacterium]|nr:hypothetical protein [bacterium]
MKPLFLDNLLHYGQNQLVSKWHISGETPLLSNKRWISNILIVYPRTPATYWDFEFANRYPGASSSHMPLAPITVAALFQEFNVRVIDENVEPLRQKH